MPIAGHAWPYPAKRRPQSPPSGPIAYELHEATEHLRITRKALLYLADEAETETEPVTPPVALPDHPAYQ
ncbi:hypothetical protein Aple_087140 [Acrocarpospora pleiomorpha]|uniref:Uncharacterized protein n=1 Tax=Acrocarpospora pleiomorpha TaxID=90975 RepID=A0A5M3XXC7_9ACTN|nr:hypothetical protein [Acrocarpospora pleiomorpha]GES25815.1 hypothetical protein Aple_087140 [Acrocarpospora pleiomorpha]